ncbi:MAG TPA: hypothetical protein VND95_04800 [Stellaceae bacterium]|nr:hypothetical protein [Stellaceae bacterium]
MALRRARFRLGGRVFRLTTGLAGLVLVVTLGACNPIEGWRSLTGISDNDPDPKTAPFTQNMAAGEAGPYPNLASVPPPPVLAATGAERQKLAQSLVAERTAVAAEAGPAAPPAVRGTQRPPAAPPTAAAATSAAAAPGAAPKPTREASNSGRRKADEPPAPQPLNSTLQMPQIPVLPQPEAARPAPPPPVLPAFAPPPPVSLPPAAVASVMPEPAPPPPVLAPIAPPPAAGKLAPPAPSATTVATLDVAAASGALTGADRRRIDRVAALYKRQPRGVQVIAYTAAPAAGADPLAGYHAALERAQAVAKALAAAGIPANQLQTQAATATDAGAAGRVAIQFVPARPPSR